MLVRGIDKGPECLLARREVSTRQDTIDDVTTEELRGDRRVRANSEEAVILLRRHGCEKLAFAGRERTLAPKRVLGEPGVSYWSRCRRSEKCCASACVLLSAEMNIRP
jgi:hypothetical protein